MDLLNSTRHDLFARSDYRLLKQLGIETIRTSARWHLIEPSRGVFDFSSLDLSLDGAADEGMEVLLDLMHFGWPNYTDIFHPEFIGDFSRFTHAVAKHLRARPEKHCFIAPVNEISYLSWAGGDEAYMNPYTKRRGSELKRILVCAAIAASEVILNELPDARLFWPEPAIHIAGRPEIPGDEVEAHNYTLAQYQAWDMISGSLDPELGGKPEYLDVLGVNFYPHNQWIHHSHQLQRSDPVYKPFRKILSDIWRRYQRPLFVSETGAEDEERPEWFNYIATEVLGAVDEGVPVQGICIYPILNHPGWVDERHCHNGLFDYPDASGNRNVYEPLAKAILRQQTLFSSVARNNDDCEPFRFNLPFAS